MSDPAIIGDPCNKDPCSEDPCCEDPCNKKLCIKEREEYKMLAHAG